MRKLSLMCVAAWLGWSAGGPAVFAQQASAESAAGRAATAAEAVGSEDAALEPVETIASEPEVLAKLPKNKKLALNDTMYVPPKVKKMVLPVYPYDLLRKKVAGFAKVSCIVGVDGRVVRTTVIEASQPEFGAALAAAVEATEFGYATVEGEPVATALGFRHTFQPRPHNRSEPKLAAVMMEELRTLEIVNRPRSVGRASQLDRPIHVKNQPAPTYPTELLSRGAQGEATIEFFLDEKGRPRLPRIVWATDPAFGYAAAQAVAAWEFDPPTQRGTPTVMRISAPFRFQTR